MLLRFTYTSDPSCSVTLIMSSWAVPSVGYGSLLGLCISTVCTGYGSLLGLPAIAPAIAPSAPDTSHHLRGWIVSPGCHSLSVTPKRSG